MPPAPAPLTHLPGPTLSPPAHRCISKLTYDLCRYAPDPRLQQMQLQRRYRNGPDKRKWICAEGPGRGRGCARLFQQATTDETGRSSLSPPWRASSARPRSPAPARCSARAPWLPRRTPSASPPGLTFPDPV